MPFDVNYERDDVVKLPEEAKWVSINNMWSTFAESWPSWTDYIIKDLVEWQSLDNWQRSISPIEKKDDVSLDLTPWLDLSTL